LGDTVNLRNDVKLRKVERPWSVLDGAPAEDSIEQASRCRIPKNLWRYAFAPGLRRTEVLIRHSTPRPRRIEMQKDGCPIHLSQKIFRTRYHTSSRPEGWEKGGSVASDLPRPRVKAENLNDPKITETPQPRPRGLRTLCSQLLALNPEGYLDDKTDSLEPLGPSSRFVRREPIKERIVDRPKRRGRENSSTQKLCFRLGHPCGRTGRTLRSAPSPL